MIGERGQFPVLSSRWGLIHDFHLGDLFNEPVQYSVGRDGAQIHSNKTPAANRGFIGAPSSHGPGTFSPSVSELFQVF